MYVQSLFYAIFEGFKSFYKTGAKIEFSERLSGPIFEGIIHAALQYVALYILQRCSKHRKGSAQRCRRRSLWDLGRRSKEIAT